MEMISLSIRLNIPEFWFQFEEETYFYCCGQGLKLFDSIPWTLEGEWAYLPEKHEGFISIWKACQRWILQCV